MAVRRGYRHQVTIGSQTVQVDSLLEEHVLRLLDTNGFSQRWRRPAVGLHYRGNNYTPDIELYIEHAGRNHLAIVEIKPTVRGRFGFNDYIFRRMRRAAKLYYSDILLLHVDDTKTWYRINNKTGELNDFGIPKPASKAIDKAYRPFTVSAKSVYHHQYKQRLDHVVAKTVLRGIANILRL